MEEIAESVTQAPENSTDIRYAVIDGNSVVNVILWDGIETPTEASETPFRDSFGSQVLLQLPVGSAVAPGWSYDGTDFSPPAVVPPPPMTAEQAQAMKTALIAEATTRIAPLQDMVDMGDASPEEEAELLAWKRYRIALTRITSTTAGWPASIVWPEAPQ